MAVNVVEEDFNIPDIAVGEEVEVDVVDEDLPVDNVVEAFVAEVVAEVVNQVDNQDDDEDLGYGEDEDQEFDDHDEEVRNENDMRLAEGLSFETVQDESDWLFHSRRYQLPMQMIKRGRLILLKNRLYALEEYYNNRKTIALIGVRHFSFHLHSLLLMLERCNKKYFSPTPSLNSKYKNQNKASIDKLMKRGGLDLVIRSIPSRPENFDQRLNIVFYIIRYFYKNMKMHYCTRYMKKFSVDKKDVPNLLDFYRRKFERTGSKKDNGIY